MAQQERLYRLPAYGQFAGVDTLFPVQFLPKNYSFFLPYVVGFSSIGLTPNGSVVLTYNQPSDSDFLIFKQYSYQPAETQYQTGLNSTILATMRIPNVGELTSSPTLLDMLFPDQTQFPFVWELPLHINAGDALEIILVNQTNSNIQLNLVLSGVRAYL